MAKLISIIVPVYNVEPYLERCIQSLIDQTYQELQIVLIDDESRDKSGGICDEYAMRDSRITVIHQEHKGASAARNAGLHIAEGEYIGFVDADDWCEAEMFSEMLKAMQVKSVDAVRCNYRIVQGNSRRLAIPKPMGAKIVTGREAITDTLYHTEHSGFGTTVWNTLFKTNIARVPEELLFVPDMQYGEDLDWLRRYLIRCDSVLLMPQCYYNYNRDNVLSTTNNSNYMDVLQSLSSKIDFLTEHDFSKADILQLQKWKENVQIHVEINDYIAAEREMSTPVINKVSIIKDILAQKGLFLGTMKLSLVVAMIKLRVSPKMVGKIWGLRR